MITSLSLSSLFGPGASQTPELLTISKSALVGLSPANDNTAESLFVAILLTAMGNWQGLITANGHGLIANGRGLGYNQPRDTIEKVHLFNWRTSLRPGAIIHQLVLSVFIAPPTEVGVLLAPGLVDYGN